MNLAQLLNKLKSSERPPLERYYIYIFIAFMAYLVGDLSTLYMRNFMLPMNPPPKKVERFQQRQAQAVRFSEVVSNNIFNSDRIIPQSIGEKEGGVGPIDGEPVLSQLPIALVGTIVHANPRRSIATILLRGNSSVDPYRQDEDIASLATVVEIQREKVIIRNKDTRGLEYIEIPKDERIVISTAQNVVPTAAPAGDKTEFNFTRAEIDKQLENLPKLLQEARAVPDMGPDGNIRCYRLVDIQAGSMYENIGLKKNDCIKEVNGEPVTSPQKAMELYQALKNNPEINVTVDRGGQDVPFKYNISQ